MRRLVSEIGCLLLLCSLSLRAEVAEYVFSSYHELSASGDVPDGSSAVFYNDTQSGMRISGGHTATLTLSGYDGLDVRSIRMRMRSNKSAGAGSMQVLLGDSVVYSRPDAPFADEAWYGAYVSDSFVTISVPLERVLTVPDGTELIVRVQASVNSLYWSGCSIAYGTNGIGPKVVGFSTGTDVRIEPMLEPKEGRGVVLPSLEDADSVWHFMGWTEPPVAHTTAVPLFYEAGSKYHPARNMTLYALYTNASTIRPLTQDTSLTSGVYAIVSTGQKCMMSGRVNNYQVEATLVDVVLGADSLWHWMMDTIPQQAQYELDFSDSGVTIKHVQSGSFIGHSGKKLRSAADEWNVYQSGNGSLLFYHDMTADSMAYCLYARLIKTEDGFEYKFEDSSYPNILNATASGFTLFPVPDTPIERALYTTNPRSGVGLVRNSEEDVVIIRDCIQNPNGVLLQLYSVDGRLLRSARTDVSLTELPSGPYIVRTPVRAQKIIIR